MLKTKRNLYIFGCSAVGILCILLLYFTLIATGVINLLQANLVVSSDSLDRYYTGQVYSNHNYEIESGSVKNNETIYATFLNEISEVGEVENSFYITIVDDNGNDVTTKYNIVYLPGTLKIKALPIIISTPSATKAYDGISLSNENYTIMTGEILENHTLLTANFSSINSVGEVDNDFQYIVVDEFGKDVSNVYNIEKKLGTLSITGRTLTITTFGATKIYDGVSLTNEEYEYSSDSLLDGHILSVKTIGERVLAGSSKNYVNYYISDLNGNDVTSLYEVFLNAGELIVEKRELSITSNDFSKTYDLEPLVYEEYTVSNMLDGHYEKVTFTNFITDVGNVKNTYDVQIYNEFGENVTLSFDISKDYGVLEVTPYVVYLTSLDVTKDYDGTFIFSTEYSFKDSTRLLGDHKEYIVSYMTFNEPGSIQNEIEFTVYSGTVDVTKNYFFDNGLGKLTINEISLSIYSKYYTKQYDGEELISEEDYIVIGTLFEDHYIRYINESSITNVGEIDNFFEYYIYDLEGNDVSNYYNVRTTYEKLLVTACDVKILIGSAETTYSASIFKEESYKVIFGEFYNDDYIVVSNYTECIVVGTHINSATVTLNGDKNNYNFEIITGLVTISKQNITITTNSDSKVYDATPIVCEGYSISGNLYDSISVTYSCDEFNVGVYSNTITYSIVNGDNYNVTVIPGELVITSQLIVVQTGSASQVYSYDVALSEESFELIYGNFYYSGGGIVSDEYSLFITVSNYTTATNPGVYANYASVTLTDFDNYDLVVVWGALNIFEDNKEMISITPIDFYVEYTGSLIDVSGVDSYSSLKGFGYYTQNGYTYYAEIVGEGKDVGYYQTYVNQDTFAIYLGLEDVTNQFNVQFNIGKLIIYDTTVTFSSNDVSKVYDGDSLSADNISVVGLPTNYTYEIIGQISDVSSIKPTITIYDEYNSEVDYLNVVNNLGMISIEKRSIDVKVSNFIGSGEIDISKEKLEFLVSSVDFDLDKYEFFVTAEGICQPNSALMMSNVEVLIYLDGVDVTSNFSCNVTSGMIMSI